MTATVEENGVKDLLERWTRDGCFRDYDLHIKLWCAFEAQGFSGIRLWIEPYERPHRCWRFSAECAMRTSTRAVERAIRAACEDAGYVVEKDFVAALVSNRRARGGFILEA